MDIKPLYKRWWVWFLILALIGGIASIFHGEDAEITKDETTQGTKIKETQEEAIDLSWDGLKGQIVGKSNKNYLDITNNKPTDIRNDVTNKWKKSTIAENIEIEKYLLSYKDLYMEEGDTHFIINFNYNTTTVVNYTGGLLHADIKEYVSKEEHDAKKIGGGMLLKSLIVYPDGDIEEAGG